MKRSTTMGKNGRFVIIIFTCACRVVMYRYFSIGMGGISLLLWYRVVVSVSVRYSQYLPMLIEHKINIKTLCYIFFIE